ncbi:MAG: hypothetical protein PUK40_01230 [Actinomycetaceae bacterium]|nr:hypothetical protein [Arcanobacterium sp.]MDD7504564.1 hypothetical protein [Actinomycetaceae bacterium]MDY6143207.1 hypothetical protein [Arcanobacterium sp.]
MNEAKWPQSQESDGSSTGADGDIIAEPDFAMSPDPLLDIHISNRYFNLYHPGPLLWSDAAMRSEPRFTRQLPRWLAGESRHEQSRSWRDHPSNFHRD